MKVDKIPVVKVAKFKIKMFLLVFLLFFFFIIGVVILFMIGSINTSDEDMMFQLGEVNEEDDINSDFNGSAKLSPEVLFYKDVVEKELKKYDMEEYVDIVLGIMEVESGGKLRDIMQSSESIGLPVNTIQDPVKSIEVGVEHFYNSYQRGQKNDVDIETVIQSYNYGTGFVDYVAKNGKKYSFEVAKNFAKEQSGGAKVVYSNPIAIQKNGGWRYQYGNMFYVALVKQHLVADVSDSDEGVALDGDSFDIIMKEAEKFDGYPYQWGGASPSTSFDCSGLMMWVYGKAGINLPRTSYEQYNATKRINKDELKKGDLIFFKTADYNPITHVGIYVGDNKMFDANNGGIGYTELENYWSSKIVGYGRVE